MSTSSYSKGVEMKNYKAHFEEFNDFFERQVEELSMRTDFSFSSLKEKEVAWHWALSAWEFNDQKVKKLQKEKEELLEVINYFKAFKDVQVKTEALLKEIEVKAAANDTKFN